MSALNPYVNLFYDWAEIKVKDLPHLKQKNFFEQFVDDKEGYLVTITPSQFVKCWIHYSRDGFIEGKMLDRFFVDYCECVNFQEREQFQRGGDLYRHVRKGFMEMYDTNEDGQLDIVETVKTMPFHSHFFDFFRKPKVYPTSVEFMKCWKFTDKNNDGFIDECELNDYISSLILTNENSEIDEQEVDEIVRVLMFMFDVNRDRKLHLSEIRSMVKIAEQGDPWVCRAEKITSRCAKELFKYYDRDKNHIIDDFELDALLCDVLAENRKNYHYFDIIELKDNISRKIFTFNKTQIQLNKKEFAKVVVMLKEAFDSLV
ncbi:calbindin-32-like protein [Leptotrombidium deliense]|uniref:Calbindin-32-like protein n=1 Tax=Leptotrombidium deliense TaxID=299467 RepID=A0A443S9A1_9ACAR|nr:calbindin-32-like protein [Leptotrombidium deliense]